jgi:hypothetical protein
MSTARRGCDEPPSLIVLGHAGSIIHRSAEDTITTVEQAVNDWVV